MFNLHYMFLFTVFLPDRSIAALPSSLFWEMPHYIAEGVPRAQRRKTNKEKQDAEGTFFPACFIPCTSRSTYCVPIATYRLLYLGDAQVKRNIRKH